ncbi:MAG TPA: hypothetical protein DIW15_04585 [Bavariicoccus seileri]|uniref:Polymerase n=1 Tax=Bavariicoccus seileri TaxID=549685 RepID=A0A3D4S585_9ENTE|nr:hypothetical protein [Bavariicoccus seileri]HCS93967.1 hypothetical protein [Bavariicoccus seileri]
MIELKLKKSLFQLTPLFVYLMLFYSIQSSMLSMSDMWSAFFWNSKNLILVFSLCISFIINKYSKQQLMIIFCFLVPSIVTRFVSGSSPTFDLLVFIILLKNTPIKSVLKTILSSQVLSFFLVILMYRLSIIPDRVVVRSGVIRSSLGFWHPNTTGMIFLSIFLLSMVLAKQKYEYIFLAIFNVLATILVSITASRTMQILVLIASIGFVCVRLLKFEKVSNTRLAKVVLLVFILCILLSYFLALIYRPQNQLLSSLNTLLSGRLRLGNLFVEEYSVSLFGTRVLYNTPNANYQTIFGLVYRVLDNSYLKYLLNFGVLSLATLSIIVYQIFIKSPKIFLSKLFVSLMAFLGLAFTEQLGLSMEINFVLFVGVVIMASEKSNNSYDLQEEL